MDINDLKDYCKRKEIFALSYNEAKNVLNRLELNDYAEKYRGFAINKGKFKAIFYNDALPSDVQFAVCAHEIGHHLLEHIGERVNLYLAEEVEADVFAAVITALCTYKEIKLSQ